MNNINNKCNIPGLLYFSVFNKFCVYHSAFYMPFTTHITCSSLEYCSLLLLHHNT